ncbi:TPA: hypothetical protein WMY39_002235, partial [Neisseria gonorrhoeae]
FGQPVRYRQGILVERVGLMPSETAGQVFFKYIRPICRRRGQPADTG